MANEHELDSLFEQFAKKVESDTKSASKGSYTPKDYEAVKYTGLETGIPKVIRAVGAPIDSNVDDFTARSVTISRVVGDDGKRFRVIRPKKEVDPNHILNRIIDRVTQPKWVNNEKTFPVKEQYPEIFNIIEKNGLQKNDPKYLYDRGWKGKEVIIMNVIDREMMDWHRANNHTMLLAKDIKESGGIEYADEGISTFAASSKIAQLYKYYGSWEKYDIAITKTGNMNNAFIIENASKNPERVEGKASNYISYDTKLSSEEKSWERYDLAKLFRVTSYTKIYNRLKGTIARIDAALNTHFLTELEAEVAKEKQLFEELYGKEEDAPQVSSVPETSTHQKESVEPAPQAAPSRVRASVKTASPCDVLPYGSTLSESMKNKVVSVVKGTGNFYDITWDFPIEQLAACPNCNTVAHLEVTKCPSCGMDF